MLKTVCIFIGLVMVLGAGIAMAWPRADAAASGFNNDEWTLRAYAQVHTGIAVLPARRPGRSTPQKRKGNCRNWH